MKTKFHRLNSIALVLLTFFCSLLTVSCDTDNLKIEQQGTLTTDTYLTDDDDGVLAFIAAVYAGTRGDAFITMMGDQAACYTYYLYYEALLSDDCVEQANITNMTSESSVYSQLWCYFYQTIMRCTMIIENVPNNKVASADVINRVVAEARVIRAIGMMYLVQFWGTPPLADHLLEGNEGNTPAEESWAWIEEELTEAAEDLPTKSGLGGQAAIGGRLTREAAYAYLGRAQLWQGNYADAATTLYDKVISTGKYALYDSYTYYNSASLSDFSDENIWEYNFDDNSSYATGQMGCFDLVCFSPPIYYWYSTYASLLMAWNMSGCPSLDFVEFLIDHDGVGSDRYNASVLDVCTASTMGSFNSVPVENCQGYIRVKDVCLAEDLVGTFPYQYSIRNTAYMRYAEVLLNYAEAVCMGGSNGSSLSGLEALNLVRRRAGLDDAPSLDMNNATYGIKAERRAELFHEGYRLIDLIRWGDAAEALADLGTTNYDCNFTSGTTIGGYLTVYTDYEIVTNSTGGSGFQTGKHELFPIPQTEINNNSNLTQNPGW